MDILTRLISDVLRIDEDKVAPEIAIHEHPRWDSLTHIELVVMIEETYRVELTADEIVTMTTVGRIRDILKRRGVLPER